MTDEDEDIGHAPPPADGARQILSFWFDEHGDSDWFGGGPEFDAEVTERFSGWRDALRSQPVEAFLEHADTALAAIILFDQVPRNAFAARRRPLPPTISRSASRAMLWSWGWMRGSTRTSVCFSICLSNIARTGTTSASLYG